MINLPTLYLNCCNLFGPFDPLSRDGGRGELKMNLGGELRIKFRDIEGPTMVESDANENF